MMGLQFAFEGQAPAFTNEDVVEIADDIKINDLVIFERIGPSQVVIRAISNGSTLQEGNTYRAERRPKFDGIVFVQMPMSGATVVATPDQDTLASPSPQCVHGKYDHFPVEVIEKLKYHVYRLIDPRNGETFYVGKGNGNRVFAHVRAQVESDDDNKLKRIHEIHLAGFEVAHVIHRHGMDEKTAIEVEAALIDAYPGLTNVAGGAGSGDFGVMHAKEIIEEYSAIPATFRHRAMLINVNRTAGDMPLYEATRFAWKVGKNATKAKQAEVILAVKQGIIVGAFKPHRWLPATIEDFPLRGPSPDRWGFEGEEASPELKALYVGKRVPDEYRKKGAASPLRYTWKSQHATQSP